MNRALRYVTLLLLIALIGTITSGCWLKESIYDLIVFNTEARPSDVDIFMNDMFQTARIDSAHVLVPSFVCTQRGNDNYNDEFILYLTLYSEDESAQMTITSIELFTLYGEMISHTDDTALVFDYQYTDGIYKGEIRLADNYVDIEHKKLVSLEELTLRIKYAFMDKLDDEGVIEYAVTVQEATFYLPFLGL